MTPRLLLVDDNPLDRELVIWTLRKLPCPPGPVEIVCAGSWEEASPLLAARDIKLLLLDYNLPGRSGLEILRSLPNASRPRVIMITGQSDAETAGALLREGAYDYVSKGADWGETLSAAVCLALENLS